MLGRTMIMRLWLFSTESDVPGYDGKLKPMALEFNKTGAPPENPELAVAIAIPNPNNTTGDSTGALDILKATDQFLDNVRTTFGTMPNKDRLGL